jgi:hypothetical protein
MLCGFKEDVPHSIMLCGFNDDVHHSIMVCGFKEIAGTVSQAAMITVDPPTRCFYQATRALFLAAGSY